MLNAQTPRQETALQLDDECLAAESCAFNALQLKGSAKATSFLIAMPGAPNSVLVPSSLGLLVYTLLHEAHVLYCQ